MKKHLLAAALIASAGLMPARAQLLISEFMANPQGTDSPFEFVELIAASDIDFSLTPYSVVFANGTSAGAPGGWASGGTISYGFNITSGTVARGDVVYVGGSSMLPTGVKLRVIDTGTTPGDGFGDAAGGVLGNGGSVPDGLAVFASSINNVTPSLTPIDALFFGSSQTGAVFLTSFQVPNNDTYSGGTMNETRFVGPDPGGNQTIVGSGIYNPNTGTWDVARTWGLGDLTDGTSSLTLVPVPEPSTTALMVLAGALGMMAYRRRK